MLQKLFNRTVRGDFVVIDSQFPQKDPFAFKNSEITEYFSRIKNFESYTMHPMYPDEEAWFTHGYGISHEKFVENKRGYLSHYPIKPNSIKYLYPGRRYSFKLAYSYFLAETYVLLPFFENNMIPFVFVLYPGGAFGLNNDISDKMLKKIFSSEYFRGVITTQTITKDYILSRKLVEEQKVHHIYGGFVQFRKEDVLPKLHYKKEKKTFDICFVAAKYSERGIDKGYDLFVETAKILAKDLKDVRFHVVGGFDKNEIDIAGYEKYFTFYGFKKPKFLKELYSSMDIFLSPGRPNRLFKGNFDGFPLGIDAGYCGVALFVTDELKMNDHYEESIEIVIIDAVATRIANTVRRYYNDTEKLYEISLMGQKKTQSLFDINRQIDDRIKVFNQFTPLEELSQGDA